MKKIICIIICSCCMAKGTGVFSQRVMKPFTVIGYIAGIDTGSFELVRLVDSLGNQIMIENGGSIINGKFIIKGKISYPHAFSARVYKKNSMVPTEIFFIEPGTQYLNGLFDSIKYTVPLNTAKTNTEFLSGYWPKYQSIDKLYEIYSKELRMAGSEYGQSIPDSVKIRIDMLRSNFITKRDSLIFYQAIQFPGSYVSLWVLTERFFISGYKEIYENSFNTLSLMVKGSRTGQFLEKHIQSAKILAKGQKFPFFTVSNVEGKAEKFNINARYTLLDFWFSRCGPCIAQFPDLKTLYQNFNKKGFDIIGLSTDQIEDKVNLKKVIEKHELPWKQLWDKDAVQSLSLTINAFPTNFLLDEKGVIIERNISPVSLKNFLEKKLQ